MLPQARVSYNSYLCTKFNGLMLEEQTPNGQMNGNVKVFNFPPDEQVLVFLDFDMEKNEFYLSTVCYTNGKTYTADNQYGDFHSLALAFQSYDLNAAKTFHKNSLLLDIGAPLGGVEYLKEYDFDTFCDWVESQDPFNLPNFRKMMVDDGNMGSYVKVLDYFMKKNDEKVVK